MTKLTRAQAHHAWQVRRWFTRTYGQTHALRGMLYHFETMREKWKQTYLSAGKNPVHSPEYNYFSTLLNYAINKAQHEFTQS